MSAFSTLRITRSKAREMFFDFALPAVTDKMLEEFLDEILEKKLYNVIIVSDNEENDNNVI